jgi:hypothetical protein
VCDGEIGLRGHIRIGLFGGAGLGHGAAAAVDGGGGAAKFLRVIGGLDDVLELVEGEEAGLCSAQVRGVVGEFLERGEVGLNGG